MCQNQDAEAEVTCEHISTRYLRGCPPPSHGRGQDGSLFLLLYDSFIHYFTPVYPDVIQIDNLIDNLPHKLLPQQFSY
jgi:hypothetical protein